MLNTMRISSAAKQSKERRGHVAQVALVYLSHISAVILQCKLQHANKQLRQVDKTFARYVQCRVVLFKHSRLLDYDPSFASQPHRNAGAAIAMIVQ